MLATVAANNETLEELFRSGHFERYLADQDAATRSMLHELRAKVTDSSVLADSATWAEFFGIFQTFQRVTEAADQNLSDALFNVCELLRRVRGFNRGPVTLAVRATAEKCILFRWGKLYTTDIALAAFCDPQRTFTVPASVDAMLPGFNLQSDAFACLKRRVEVLPAEEQKLILMAYSELVAGKIFADDDALELAEDMPLRDWWVMHRETRGMPGLRLLSERVLERLYVLSPAQAGVERLNSTYKFIQAGRMALSSVNARRLTYLYINRRLLEEYHGAEPPAAGAFALGRRWPKGQGLDNVLDDAAAVSFLDKVQVTLAQSIAAMEADDEEALRAEKEEAGGEEGGARRSPRVKKTAKEHAAGGVKRKGGGKASPGPAKGAKKARVSEAAAARRRLAEAVAATALSDSDGGSAEDGSSDEDGGDSDDVELDDSSDDEAAQHLE